MFGFGVGRSGFIPSSVGVIVELLQHLLNSSKTLAENYDNGTFIDTSTDGDARDVQRGRCYNFDGVDDYLSFSHLVGTETVVSYSGTGTPSISAGRIDCTAGTLWDVTLSDGTFLKCDEQGGTVAYDSSGNGNHGTIINATESTFHATQDTYSWQNEVGYRDGFVGNENIINGTFDTDISGWTNLTNCQWDNGELNCANGQFTQKGVVSGEGTFRVSWEQTVNSGTRSRLRLRSFTNSRDVGPFNYYAGSGYKEIILTTTNGLTILFVVESQDDVNFDNISVQEYIPETTKIPRDESTPTLDVLGNTLQYSGRVPYNAKAVQSNCANFNEPNNYVDCPINTNFYNDEFEISFYVIFTTIYNLVIMEVNENNGWSVQTKDDGIIVTTGGVNDYIRTTNTFNDDKVHFVEISNTIANGRTIKVDGVLEDSRAYISPIYTQSSKLSIGGRGSSYSFGGTLFGIRYKDANSAWEAYYPLQGTTYDVSGNGNHGTAMNITEATFWDTQDDYHYNFEYGFDIWTRDSDGYILRVPYDINGTPIKTSGDVITGYTWASTHPAGNFHNGAETKIQPNPNDAPALVQKGVDNTFLIEHSIAPAPYTKDVSGENEKNYKLEK